MTDDLHERLDRLNEVLDRREADESLRWAARSAAVDAELAREIAEDADLADSVEIAARVERLARDTERHVELARERVGWVDDPLAMTDELLDCYLELNELTERLTWDLPREPVHDEDEAAGIDHVLGPFEDEDEDAAPWRSQ